MVEDLKELRNKLDRLIAKYEREAELRGDNYMFEHDPRLADELAKKEEQEINDNEFSQEGCWNGNDYY